MAGFLASPHFEYLPSVTTESNIEFWAQIGIVVLLFSLGLEFSFQETVECRWVGSSYIADNSCRNDVLRFRHRYIIGLFTYKQPFPWWHDVDVVYHNNNKGTYRLGDEAA